MAALSVPSQIKEIKRDRRAAGLVASEVLLPLSGVGLAVQPEGRQPKTGLAEGVGDLGNPLARDGLFATRQGRHGQGAQDADDEQCAAGSDSALEGQRNQQALRHQVRNDHHYQEGDFPRGQRQRSPGRHSMGAARQQEHGKHHQQEANAAHHKLLVADQHKVAGAQGKEQFPQGAQRAAQEDEQATGRHERQARPGAFNGGQPNQEPGAKGKRQVGDKVEQGQGQGVSIHDGHLLSLLRVGIRITLFYAETRKNGGRFGRKTQNYLNVAKLRFILENKQ